MNTTPGANVIARTEGMSNPYKYSGELYDEKTGFYYLRARYYDPTVGRFISEDAYKGAVDNPIRAAMACNISINERNGVTSGVSQAKMMDVIKRISKGELKDLDVIEKELRGF